jgi:hypothetical protein
MPLLAELVAFYVSVAIKISLLRSCADGLDATFGRRRIWDRFPVLRLAFTHAHQHKRWWPTVAATVQEAGDFASPHNYLRSCTSANAQRVVAIPALRWRLRVESGLSSRFGSMMWPSTSQRPYRIRRLPGGCRTATVLRAVNPAAAGRQRSTVLPVKITLPTVSFELIKLVFRQSFAISCPAIGFHVPK